MKRTIKEVYDIIEAKINNAQLDRVSRHCKGINSILLEGEINAYNDVLSLIESSHLLEEDKSKKALEVIKEVDKTLLLQFIAIGIKDEDKQEFLKEVLL